MKSFRELLSEDTELLYEEEENELTGYYLYFIIFRSPKDVGKWNLYVGIKHSKDSPASKFFGSLRYSGKGSYFESSHGGGKSYFEDQLFRLKPGEEAPEIAASESYMSSAVLVSSESITTAYQLGIGEQKLAYHPLICHPKVLNNVRKNTGYDNLFVKIKKIVINFVRKIQKKKEQDETVYLPVEVGDREKQLQYATSSDYGYRIYVCDDMQEYSKVLDAIIEDSKNINFSRQKDIEKTRAKQEDNPENNAEREERYAEQANDIATRFWKALKSTFSNFPNYNEYQNFLMLQFDPKTSTREICRKKLQIVSAEAESQRSDNKGEEEGQANNSSLSGSFKNKPEIFAACYLPDSFMKKDLIEKALKACEARLGGSSNADDDSSDTRVLVDSTEEIDNMKRLNVEMNKIKKLNKNSNGFTNAALSFTAANSIIMNGTGKRNNGLRDNIEKIGKITTTLMYNSKTDLLRKALKGDSSAVSELKRIFEKIEIPIALRKHPRKELKSLCIVLSDDNNKDYIVCKKGKDDLILRKDVHNVSNSEFFSMYDLVLLLGYPQISNEELKAAQKRREKNGIKAIIRKNSERIEEFASRVKIGPSLSEEVQLQELSIQTTKSSKPQIMPIYTGKKVSSELRKSNLKVPDFTNVDRQLSKLPDKTKKAAEDLKKKADQKIAKGKQQSDRTNRLALNFIRSLFTDKAKNYNSLFYEDENGVTKPIQLKDLQGILLKPKEQKLAEEFNIRDHNRKDFSEFLIEGFDTDAIKNMKPIDKEKFKVFSPNKMQNDLKKAIDTTKNPQVKKLYQEILTAYQNNDQDLFNSLKSQIRSILNKNK